MAHDDNNPSAFIQWKNTDLCMDFYCDCGAHGHFDGFFAYAVECAHCGQVWIMPTHIVPEKASEASDPYWVKNAQKLEPDDDFCDPMTVDGITVLKPCALEKKNGRS